MGLKRKLNAAVKPVYRTEEEASLLKERPVKGLRAPGEHKLPTSEVLEVRDAEPEEHEPGKFSVIEVKGSNGKIYKTVIPQSYEKFVPKTWEWNEKRYKVAEMLSAGVPITEICRNEDLPTRTIVYGWLKHPEFKDHVDGLTLESGWANKQERIAGLNKVTRMLFKKVVDEIDKVKLTDKSIGPVLSSLQMIAKQIGIEKEEFVEQAKVEQQTTLSGAIGVATVDIANVLNQKTSEERQQLEAEFNSLSNDIIRAITGDKD